MAYVPFVTSTRALVPAPPSYATAAASIAGCRLVAAWAHVA